MGALAALIELRTSHRIKFERWTLAVFSKTMLRLCDWLLKCAVPLDTAGQIGQHVAGCALLMRFAPCVTGTGILGRLEQDRVALVSDVYFGCN